MANYSLGRKPIPDVPNGHKFTGDNFTQLLPHTAILTGKTGLQFENCNLCNCDLPIDSVYIGCGPTHCEFCGNLHPDWIVELGLTECDINCVHVTEIDEVIIDGQTLGKIYHYADLGVV